MLLLVLLQLLVVFVVAQTSWSSRNTNALIAAGENVVLDSDVNLSVGLVIQGTLTCGDVDLKITVPYIAIKNNGRFICGTATNRYLKKLTITLTGPLVPPETNAAIFHSKNIHVVDNGQLDLHGALRSITWTQLGATASAGATQITLKEAVDWKVGEEIVIASTDFDMNQAEQRTITATTGTVITLDRPLKFMHFGVLQTYKGNTLTLDERAEVGLLTRNILIRGDTATAEAKKHGAHIIMTDKAQGRIDGIEMMHAGLGTTLGRYPMHWHLIGKTNGLHYARRNAIHHTFNRCLVIHGTDGLDVSDNICFDNIGHAYFIEDGHEVQNVLVHNLGLVTRVSSVETATIPTDTTHVSTFWITNPSNTFRLNAAAGSDVAGFWYALPITPTKFGKDRTDIHPLNTNILVFDDNRGHSNSLANLGIDGSPNPNTLALDDGHYAPYVDAANPASGPAIPTINRFTSFKSRARAVWMRANTMIFKDCVNADNGLSTLFAFNQINQNALYVGVSANTGTPVNPTELAAGMSLPSAAPTLEGTYFIGHAIYDGPTVTQNCHFANFNKPWVKSFSAVGAALKSTAHQVLGLTWENTPDQFRVNYRDSGEMGTIFSSGIIDRDGSLTGRANVVVIARPLEHPERTWRADVCFTATPGKCQDRKDWNANVCTTRIGNLYMAPYYPIDNSDSDDVSVVRSDGFTTTVSRVKGTFGGDQFPVVIGEGFQYRFIYSRIPGRLSLRLTFVNAGDSLIVELPNWPTLVTVHGATKVNEPGELQGVAGNSYLQHNNNVWVRLVATATNNGYRDHAGAAIGTGTADVMICVNPNCAATPLRYTAALADFESGVDVHATVAAQAPLTIALPLSYAWTTPFNTAEANDDINYYDVTATPLNERKYADFALNFAPQNWQMFRAIRFKSGLGCVSNCKATIGNSEVHIFDKDQGYIYLGAGTGEFELQFTPAMANNLDAVSQLVFRIYNDHFCEASNTCTLRNHMYGIHLMHFSNAAESFARKAPFAYKETACSIADQVFAAVPATPVPTPLPVVRGWALGHVDIVTEDRVAGWACDLDAGSSPLSLHVYINGQFYDAFNADQPRPDVPAAVPDCLGENHGFVHYWRTKGPVNAAAATTPATVTVYAIGVGADGKADGFNPALGTKVSLLKPLANPPAVTPPPAPVGSLEPTGSIDTFDPVTGISGWACDGDMPQSPVTVRIAIDSFPFAEIVANGNRPDLISAVPACGGSAAHGYSLEWTGDRVDQYLGRVVVVTVTFVNLVPAGGTSTRNPVVGSKMMRITRKDAPAPTTTGAVGAPATTQPPGVATTTTTTSMATTRACATGSLGCVCGAGATCDETGGLGGGKLQCVGNQCVVMTCTPGSTGCQCAKDSKCNSANDACQSDRCVVKTCAFGERGCGCIPTNDPTARKCSSSSDECALNQCLPVAQCSGGLGCACRGGTNACDAGLECAPSMRCLAPSCVPGALGCRCAGDLCVEGLVCNNGACVEANCDGRLACPCRSGVAVGGVGSAAAGEVGECDVGLVCAKAVASRGFCVKGSLTGDGVGASSKDTVNVGTSNNVMPGDNQKSPEGLSVAVIVLIVVACVVLLLVVGAVIVVLMRRDSTDSGSGDARELGAANGVRCPTCNSLYATPNDLQIHQQTRGH